VRRELSRAFATPLELGAAFEIPILPDGRQFMLEIHDEDDTADNHAHCTEVEQDRLEGEGKQRGKIEEPREIRHASPDHSAKVQVN
jgi:hypothetical protein